MTKPLTKAQKKKADKIVRLCKELQDDGVTTFLGSTPDWALSFLRDYEPPPLDNEHTELRVLADDTNMYYPFVLGLILSGYAY